MNIDYFRESVEKCSQQSTNAYIFGCFIFAGAILGYIPQLVSLAKAKSNKGIRELSVFLLCLSLSTMTMNSLIMNWYKWECFYTCENAGICFLNLLNLFQIGMSWLMATSVYVLFMRFKCSVINES